MKRSLRMLALALMASSGLARADDYGCTVLLCLANPAGPKAVPECVPSITRLFRDLARGRAFPTCAMASAPDAQGGQSWAEHKVVQYDECPSGTTALGAGAYAARSTADSTYFVGIGEGDNLASTGSRSLPNKICVGNRIGEKTLNGRGGDALEMAAVGVFDEVTVIAPNAQPNYIDVYVNSAFSHRVRW